MLDRRPRHPFAGFELRNRTVGMTYAVQCDDGTSMAITLRGHLAALKDSLKDFCPAAEISRLYMATVTQ